MGFQRLCCNVGNVNLDRIRWFKYLSLKPYLSRQRIIPMKPRSILSLPAKKLLSLSAFILLSLSAVVGQVCVPTFPPSGLDAMHTPGTGVQLTWDPIPGSVAVQLKIITPSGGTIKRNIFGPEPDQFLIAETFLTAGIYSWRIQASCNTTLPLVLTPVSGSDLFTIGGGTGFCPTTLTDVDGNNYNVVEIDGKCWMQENLRVQSYRNGDPIPAITSSVVWATTTTGAASVYDNELVNATTYGLIYNGQAATDPRGLCPIGWNVPTSPEWSHEYVYAIFFAQPKAQLALQPKSALYKPA